MQSTKRRASLVLERRTSLSFMAPENAYDEPTVAVMQEDELACYTAPSDINMKEYSNNLQTVPQASRRLSLGISMEDIYDLTGEPFDIMAEKCTSQELDPSVLRHGKQQHLGLDQMNDCMPQKSVVFRRTSLSFMPINSSDPFNFNFDMEGDDLNLLDASDIQGIWESEDMLASSSSQIDPYNPLQDPEFAKRYELQLEDLIKCMKKSSSTRSKVALIKKDIKSKFSFRKQQQKLAPMGLNKSQDTRKYLLEMGKRSKPLLETSSGLQKVSYCDIKSSRRRSRHSPVPTKAVSHTFDPTEYEKQNIRSVSMDVSLAGGSKLYNTMDNGGFKMMMNRNKYARRRSSLTLQTYQMQFFPDF